VFGNPERRRSAAFRRVGPGRHKLPARVAARAHRVRLRLRGRRSGWSTSRCLLIAYAAGAVAVAATRRRSGVPPAVALSVASVAPLAVAAAMPPGRWRYVATGAAYMWVFQLTWSLPYDDPDGLRERLHVRYPIRIDSWLGGGVVPTLRLQRALRGHHPDRVSALDKAVVAIYASWFVPHLVLGWIWLHHEEFVPRAAGRLAAAYHLTTPFYWLAPTAPPWWASESAGEMGGEVRHVLRLVLRELRHQPPEDPDVQQKSGNPWGSMPSDHIASAAITAMALSEVNASYGALGWAYVALASFSVVYLGEHYVVDVLAGLAVAEAVQLAEPALNPLAHRVAQGLERVVR
jgi:membrane-associated phospholipid phosphatase